MARSRSGHGYNLRSTGPVEQPAAPSATFSTFMLTSAIQKLFSPAVDEMQDVDMVAEPLPLTYQEHHVLHLFQEHHVLHLFF